MTRAGKEPAEDVKRAFRRAIDFAGLKVGAVRMHKIPAATVRVVHGTAMPEDWPHPGPPVEMYTSVGFDGKIQPVQIRCCATNDDPLADVLGTPILIGCYCELDELPVTLKEVWAAHWEVITRLEDGEPLPIFDGKWQWNTVSSPLDNLPSDVD